MTGTRTDTHTYSLIELLLGPSIYPTLPATRCHPPTGTYAVPFADRVAWITDAAIREQSAHASELDRWIGR